MKSWLFASGTSLLSLFLTVVVTATVYWPGLHGDFVFDDNPHIVQNDLVQIYSLAPRDLWQAWNSSPLDFPSSRPFAMVTFGVNHAFSGLDPFAFKATNLALHLLTGLVLFAVARRLGGLFVRLEGRDGCPTAVGWWAWLTAAIWLLHPMNLSPVLLSVQRMTILSTLFVLLGLLVYLVGRQRLADGGRYGLLWIWSSPLLAVPGLLAKENALLLPLLLFVTEWTLLRFRGLDTRRKRKLGLFFLVVTALPILAAIGYLLTHPGYLGFGGRPFDMSERLLTQARVLWFYVHMLLAPDISAMGLFHDDFAISRSLLQPWTTLPAVIVLVATASVAIVVRRRLPLLSFGVLFFLAGHALESSVLPLELVYEHRNYLPAIAPLFALAYVPTVGASSASVSRGLLNVLVASVLLVLSASTAMRAYDWSAFGRFIASELENHPDSPRAGFQFAQILIAQLDNPEVRDEAAMLAEQHLNRIAEQSPRNIDSLFGLLVLSLEMGRVPPTEMLEELSKRLRTTPLNTLDFNINQFAHLVRLQFDPSVAALLPRDETLSLVDAALDNPMMDEHWKAALLNVKRAYYHRVLNDLDSALNYARLATEYHPKEWSLRDRLVRLLAIAGRWSEAEEALKSIQESGLFPFRQRDINHLATLIAAAKSGRPIPATPHE